MLEAMLQQLRNDECDGGTPNLVVYDDATGEPIVPGTTVQGHPTIGVGRALDTHGVSLPEALAMFAADVQAAEQGLTNALPWFRDLDPVRQGALTNMAFQMGVAGVLEFRVMLAHLQAAAAGDGAVAFDYAAAAALDSDWARQMARFGSRRAVTIAAQLRTGDIDPLLV